MLVLTRKVGEEILIGDNIRIVIVSRRCGAVRVGIEAPGLSIDRKEKREKHNERFKKLVHNMDQIVKEALS